MPSIVLLGLLWALVGIPVAVRFLQDRREVPMTQFQRAMGALQGPGPGADGPVAGGSAVDRLSRRRLVSTLTYAPGVLLVLAGLILDDSSMLAVAVALVNLGTAHRLLGIRVERAASRAVNRPRPPLPTFGPAPLEPPFEPRVDQVPGDAQTWGDGWQIIRPEPRSVDDLVLVDADVS
jgi:hypothetical protein